MTRPEIAATARRIVIEDNGIDTPGTLQDRFIEIVSDAIEEASAEARRKALGDAEAIATHMPGWSQPCDVADAIRALIDKEATG